MNSFQMSNGTENARAGSVLEASRIISADVERTVTDGDKEMKLLNDAARSLPPDAVKDLSSNEVRGFIFVTSSMDC